MASFGAVDDYIFAWKKLREKGLSQADTDGWSKKLDKALREMNKHQREQVRREITYLSRQQDETEREAKDQARKGI
jgi:hypothetical protein